MFLVKRHVRSYALGFQVFGLFYRFCEMQGVRLGKAYLQDRGFRTKGLDGCMHAEALNP